MTERSYAVISRLDAEEVDGMTALGVNRENQTSKVLLKKLVADIVSGQLLKRAPNELLGDASRIGGCNDGGILLPCVDMRRSHSANILNHIHEQGCGDGRFAMDKCSTNDDTITNAFFIVVLDGLPASVTFRNRDRLIVQVGIGVGIVDVAVRGSSFMACDRCTHRFWVRLR